MKFTKMHGIGNDYVYVNCFEETVENPSAVARYVSEPSLWYRFRRTDPDQAIQNRRLRDGYV